MASQRRRVSKRIGQKQVRRQAGLLGGVVDAVLGRLQALDRVLERKGRRHEGQGQRDQGRRAHLVAGRGSGRDTGRRRGAWRFAKGTREQDRADLSAPSTMQSRRGGPAKGRAGRFVISPVRRSCSRRSGSPGPGCEAQMCPPRGPLSILPMSMPLQFISTGPAVGGGGKQLRGPSGLEKPEEGEGGLVHIDPALSCREQRQVEARGRPPSSCRRGARSRPEQTRGEGEGPRAPRRCAGARSFLLFSPGASRRLHDSWGGRAQDDPLLSAVGWGFSHVA